MINKYRNNWEETIEEIMFHVDTFEIGVIDRDECQSVIEEVLAKYVSNILYHERHNIIKLFK